MKPFKDTEQFRHDLRSPLSASSSFNSGSFVPSKIGYGLEIRRGRDIFARKQSLFISSGRWTEMKDDGLIDQEVPPIVIGQLIDTLDYQSYQDQDERKTATQILESGEVLRAQTIDFDPMTSKDGRITIFDIRPRGYVANEEIPIKSRGIKILNQTISGYSTGEATDPFLDGGASSLGITREGFYGKEKIVVETFEDVTIENGLGFQVDTGDYNSNYKTGASGMILLSSEFGADSYAFAGLLK